MTKTVDVYICESGPRDGLQNLPVQIPTQVKCALIDTIAAASVLEIDAGSFVPAKVVPQFADVDAVIAHALKNTTARIGAFCPNVKGAERALAAGVHLIYFVISASEVSQPRQCTPHNCRAARRILCCARFNPKFASEA